MAAAWGAYQWQCTPRRGSGHCRHCGNVVAFVQLAATVTAGCRSVGPYERRILDRPRASLPPLPPPRRRLCVPRRIDRGRCSPYCRTDYFDRQGRGGLGKLFGKEWSVSGLKPEELRQAAGDMITQIAAKDDPAQNQGRVSTTGGPRTVTPSSGVLDAAKTPKSN